MTVSLDTTCCCKRQTRWALAHTGIWRDSQCPDTNGLMQPMLEDASMVWDPNEHIWHLHWRCNSDQLTASFIASTVQGISPDHKCPAFMAQLQLKNLQSRRTSDNVCMMTLMYSLKQSCWCPPYCRVTWAPNPLSLDNCHTAELLWHNWVLKVQGIHIMSMWSFHTWDSTESELEMTVCN